MSIFISVASYRDPETIPTITDCYSKAKYKDIIKFGVFLQEDPGFSKKENLNKSIKVDFLECDWRDSKGACWIRSSIQKNLFDNEDYYLQIDSHHRFCENWDKILIDSFQKLKKEKEKPIIGGYCPGYNPKNDKDLEDAPMKITSYPEFSDLGDLMFRPKRILNHKKLQSEGIENIKARFLSGHFIFSEGLFVHECPYDPLLYFRGEELSLSARAYTSGYDIFHPTIPVIWHEYIRKEQIKHWDDHKKHKGFLVTSDQRSSEAKRRVRQLLGMEKKNKSLGKYDLGIKRSLHEYELYCGVNFSQKLVHKYAYDIRNDSPEPYIMSQKEWVDGMMQPYSIEFDLPRNYINDAIQQNSDSFAIIVYGVGNNVIYRKDIKKESFSQYVSGNIKIKGSMESKPTRLVLSLFLNGKASTTNVNPIRISQ
jgi:hypothetical protein